MLAKVVRHTKHKPVSSIYPTCMTWSIHSYKNKKKMYKTSVIYIMNVTYHHLSNAAYNMKKKMKQKIKIIKNTLYFSDIMIIINL